MKVTYRDLEAVSETFADSVRMVAFDGHNFRIEYCIVRQDQPKPNEPLTARQLPVCRVVLPPAAAIDLFNKMKEVVDHLTAAGVMKITPPPQGPAGGQTKPH